MSVNPLDSEIYGDLFGTAEMRAVFDDKAGLQRMLDVEAALARAQAGLGVIPQDAADVIARKAKLDQIDLAELARRTKLAAAPVAGLAALLSKACGSQAGRYVHWGATTQDIADTALVLQMRDGFELLQSEIAGVTSALAGLADRHRATVMAGRTYGQQALPITFGLKAAVWLAGLIEARAELDHVRGQALKLQFGGAVGTLASLGGKGSETATALGRELALDLPDIAWHVRRGALARVAAALATLCGALAKIATDICAMTQTEVAELAEPHQPGRGGSSTMPHKRNPVSSMMILAITRNVLALSSIMQSAVIADHERAVDSWQAEWPALPQIFVFAAGAVVQARFVLEGLEVNEQRMRSNLDLTDGLLMAEAVMMALGPKLGHAPAHDLLETVCSKAVETGAGLKQSLKDNEDVEAVLSAADIDKLLDPARYIGEAEIMIDRVLARAEKLT
jgi:3-carboxy-cis,cis-muconate cycloisomerase